jgi:threonine/homoserine/homoserine lactone efflux protein
LKIDPDHSLTAIITGLIAGFLVSIPVGPINLTIINQGARRGFRWAVMIGLGAVTMEAVYCALALTGFTAFLTIPMVKSTMELLSFMFLLFLSWKYLSAKSIPDHVHSADVIEQKLHPRSAFMVGFVRVLGNPAVILVWVTLTATFLSHNWVDQTLDDRVGFVAGVGGGAALWFVLLAYGVSRGHGRISPRVLLRMEHVSGALLLIAALWIGGRIIWELHKHHQHERSRGRVAALTVQSADKCTSGTPLRQTWLDDRARALLS